MPRDAFGRLAHARVLPRMGFKRDGFDSDPLFYVKQLSLFDGVRRIEVQLSKDGRHRVSHMLNGRETTHPTGFSTVGEMCEAIKHEETRRDHKPREAVPSADIVPRWLIVQEALSVSPTKAREICRRFSVDPDRLLKRQGGAPAVPERAA